MSSRFLRSTLVIGALAAFPIATAQATQVCTTGSLSLCVSFGIASIGTDHYVLTVSFDNSNAGGSLYQFGLLDNGQTVTMTPDAGSIMVNGSSNASWHFGCTGLPDPTVCAEGPTGGGALAPGGTAFFTFTTSAALDQNLEAQAHIQAFPNLPNCSVKVSTSDTRFTSAGKDGGSFNADVPGCNVTTTIPEPASLWLVGTGLLGLAAGALRRRFRKA